MNNSATKNYSKLTKQDRENFSNPVKAAQWLLGKAICRKLPNGEVLRFYITETEAYEHDDETCYGHNGKKTKANSPLFEQGGTCCIFGEMLLISCGEKEKPDNVLIRSAGNEHIYCGGPISVYKKLQLNKTFSKTDMLTSDELWLENADGERKCCRTTRVGLSENKRVGDLKNRFILL